MPISKWFWFESILVGQLLKVLAAKFDDPSSIPRTHMVEGGS